MQLQVRCPRISCFQVGRFNTVTETQHLHPFFPEHLPFSIQQNTKQTTVPSVVVDSEAVPAKGQA
jgi:hypothetical protein